MANKFDISKNQYLGKEIIGYYHQYYTGYKQPDNPDFINTLKNTFNNDSKMNLIDAREKVVNILLGDIPQIILDTKVPNWVCVCVPRAKALSTYAGTQLMLSEAVQLAANKIQGVSDGTDCIKRLKNTFTTHLGSAAKAGKITNDGSEPYPGITIDTCSC